jgi:hypothetical protein
MNLTIDMLSDDRSVITLGVIAADELAKDGCIMFYSDDDGYVRATNTYLVNLLSLDEAVAIKVLNALGKSREEIINFLKDRQQAHTEMEKTDTTEDPSERP